MSSLESKNNIMTTKQKQRQNIATKLLNECTGIMKIDNEGYYAGYYTRYELQKAMLSEGHDAALVDRYVFSMKPCQEQHPGAVERCEDDAKMIQSNTIVTSDKRLSIG